jgi:hypothetical protein
MNSTKVSKVWVPDRSPKLSQANCFHLSEQLKLCYLSVKQFFIRLVGTRKASSSNHSFASEASNGYRTVFIRSAHALSFAL